MSTSRRSAGLGLLAYGIGTPLVAMTIGAPGGNYDDGTVATYVSRGYPATFLLAYLGLFSMLGLLVFGARMREELGVAGRPAFGLAVAGSAAGVVGWFITGGVAVAAAEGGSAVASVPHPVIYVLTEIGNLVSWCGSGFCLGVLALVLAVRGRLSTPMRAVTAVAGVCGIAAPLYFPVFLFWLWAIGFGIHLAVSHARRPEPVIQAQPA